MMRREASTCVLVVLLGLVAFVTVPVTFAASVIINEFLAENEAGLADEDGEHSDWIELRNVSTGTVNLAGWQLRDSSARWTFPATNLAAGAYLIVFASGKDRATTGSELHTDFKLRSEGEYLALVDPEGVVESKFAPYPQQGPDISYGAGTGVAASNLLAAGAACKWHVPMDDSLGTSWLEPSFSDAGWQSGTTGVGYEQGTGYEGLIGSDVGSAMYGICGSVYVRVRFTVQDPYELEVLTLKLKYDDGFVVWLNGEEVARANAAGTPPAWNALATAGHSDEEAVVFQYFDLTADRELLAAGENVLAVQALNDSTTSSDLLMLPELDAAGGTAYTAEYRYFNQPTPGSVNGVGTADLGPIIREVAHSPDRPGDSDAIWVTARVTDSIDGVASVSLRYSVMWSSTVSVTMLDDGAHHDGAAGDGVYGGAIPASASTPGQMVRWYVTATDGAGDESRYPLEEDRAEYDGTPLKLGTVIADPSISSPLPVYHWFVQNPNWYYWVDAEGVRQYTKAITWCCLYYDGEFYDRIRVRARGCVSLSNDYVRKKSWKFDFNTGHWFRFSDAYERVEEINLNTTYDDRYVRQVMAWDSYKDSGSPHCLSFHVRLHQNAQFHSVHVFVEQMDKRYLRRLGLDDEGALYKARGTKSNTTTGFAKVNREWEGIADLTAFINGIKLTGTARRNFLFDNVDLAWSLDHMALRSLIHDEDRIYKNYYYYRDSDGSREWVMFPWDVDLSFGRHWGDWAVIYANKDPYSHPLFGDSTRAAQTADPGWYQYFIDAMHDTPEIQQMFARRFRTLMDRFLQPAGTPYGQRRYENHLDALVDLLANDAVLDAQVWGAQKGGDHYGYPMLTGIVARLKAEFLAPRRTHVYSTHHVSNGGIVPDAQPANPALDIGTVEFRPASGNQAEEYIEIANPNAYAVDISGWCLSNAVEHTFKAGTVIRANNAMYVSPDAYAFRCRSTSPKGGEGLFVQGDYKGQLTAWGETIELWRDNGTLAVSHTYPGSPSSAQQYLRITEIMYNPDNGEEYEFIELKNTRSGSLDISGVSFVEGMAFTFPAGTTLAAGEYIVVVRDQTAFTALYGSGIRVGGQYTGALDNGGERLELRDAYNEKILSFQYGDGWYAPTDGGGYSLVMTALSPYANEHWEDPANWRASYYYGGSPGGDDADLGVVISEVLTHTDPPLEDAVELCNRSASAVDIGGWYLSDSVESLKKYRIPNGTVLPAGGYKVFYEYQFNADTNNPACFAFSSHGDDVWLCAADAGGNLTGYRVIADFGAAENGVSFGRYARSDGQVDFTAMASRTFGADNPASLAEFRSGTGLANSAPRIGPVVINELMYNPAAGGAEFIELYNMSGAPVALYDESHPQNTWKLTDGVDFALPGSVVLGARECALVVGMTPSTFRAAYGIPAQVQIFGPWIGSLDNGGESVSLRKPDPPDPEAGGLVPYVRVDRVAYDNNTPWPENTDGGGPSLERQDAAAYGNDPVNWAASLGAGGTPGAANSGGLVSLTAGWKYHDKGENLGSAWRSASYDDSGWAHGNAPLGYGYANIDTTVSFGDDPANKPITTYFRKAFTLGVQPGNVTHFTLRADYDDGFVAWLNGEELARGAMPGGTVSYSTLASSHSAGSYQAFDLAAHIGKLRNGVNTLAVEVHQSAPDSSDIFMDIELTCAASAGPLDLPDPPSGLTASAVSSTRIDLAWTDNSDNENGFRIDRRQSGSSVWVTLPAAGANSTARSDTGLLAGTTYTYKIQAYNSDGYSLYSNTAEATTPQGPPAAPGSLAAAALSASRIALAWADNSNNEDGFRLERRPSGGAWTNLATVAAGATAYTDTGLPPGTALDYRMQAFNAAGSSDYTAPASATTPVPVVQFADAASEQSESVGTVGFQVALSESVVVAVSVDFAVTGGTAAPGGVDYTLANGTLTFAAGATAKTIPAAVIDDGLEEPDETLVVTLSGASNANLGGRTTHTHTIRDNDRLFIAYNDLVWLAGQPTNRITTYSNSGTTAGELIDFNTGQGAGVTLAVSGGGGAGSSAPGHPAAGTDAYSVFDGVVDCHGYIGYSAPDLVLTFTGLDPSLHYELVVFGNRGEPTYTDRTMVVTLSDVAAFENQSTPGSDMLGPDDPSTAILCGYNTENGYVARFAGVEAGPDGDAVVTVGDNDTRFYVNALMLRAHSPLTAADLIAKQASWRFNDTGTNLGTAWRSVAYDDSGWSAANAVFGYGEAYIDTTVSYGADSANKHPTTYFRKTFQLQADPSAVTSLKLYVNYDDGFVAWLNGQEVARRAMPAGTVLYTTLSTGHEGGSYELIDLTAYKDALNSGSNLLAVEVHQSGPSSSDLVMDMQLTALTTAGGTVVDVPVAKGATWRYRKGTAEASSPPSEWCAPGFDDSGWASGAAPFGYGGLSYGTTLDDMRDRYACVFLRKPFTVEQPASVGELKLWARFDDAFIVWVNGHEAARVNMPGAPGSFNACDSFSAVWTNPADWTASFTGGEIPALVAGTNMLAVQLFNGALDSSDLLLDFELSLARRLLAAAEDADQDGMPDAWEQAYLPGTGETAGADADGDAFSNIDEFVAGTDPDNAGDRFQVDLAASNGNVIVSFPAVQAAGTGYEGRSRYYRLEQRTGLAGAGLWTPVPGYTNILGQGQTVTYQQPPATNVSTYYRGRVWMD
ncbi:MAG: lamin tail domain-containing protein [Kiritimatiellae bacterium]|nr:lamin tail domain-containing protein [Kiritimatiellia bacterium]